MAFSLAIVSTGPKHIKFLATISGEGTPVQQFFTLAQIIAALPAGPLRDFFTRFPNTDPVFNTLPQRPEISVYGIIISDGLAGVTAFSVSFDGDDGEDPALIRFTLAQTTLSGPYQVLYEIRFWETPDR